MTHQKILHRRQGEIPRGEADRKFRPPFRLRYAALKKDAPELTRVAEHERLLFLAQDEMVVFEPDERRLLHPQFARHPQMQTEPRLFRETKKHLFSMRAGFNQGRARERPLQQVGVDAAKDSFVGVEIDGKNFLFQSDVPLFAIKFHLSKFRHWRNFIQSAGVRNDLRTFASRNDAGENNPMRLGAS